MMRRRSPTAEDVARLAGVSRTTVSLVLNGVSDARIRPETRQRVLEAAARLNYRPHAGARHLVRGRSEVIAFVMRQTPDQVFADAFLPEVLRGLSDVLREANLHLLLFPLAPDRAPEETIRLLQERRVDGMVLSGPRFEDREWLERWGQETPVVLLGHLANSALPSVDVDNGQAAAMATRHLLRLGHRRVGLITNAPLSYTASYERWLGYRQALEEAGLPYDEALVAFGAFTPASGAAAMEQLLKLPDPPTAVFVASDVVAFGALQVIRRHGLRVPQDLALVGFDDVPLSAYLDPPLTTVHLPAEDLGRAAGQLLLQWIQEGRPPTSTIRLATGLVIRQSCGAGGGA
ncbi:HTH-type transcriptional repressor CytR [Candidatus Thermoflexus japonica]|uniref:HTH-type transcriptional repressor CytR n=1 Tax=Candidatus Thermoflexus japonica TaxID=2035417 RepID=A0A2H5Y5S4_9CHLR|nr:HTH-type transcriptional repressor CytR [Candidatus Thermoflexus japonica]